MAFQSTRERRTYSASLETKNLHGESDKNLHIKCLELFVARLHPVSGSFRVGLILCLQVAFFAYSDFFEEWRWQAMHYVQFFFTNMVPDFSLNHCFTVSLIHAGVKIPSSCILRSRVTDSTRIAGLCS